MKILTLDIGTDSSLLKERLDALGTLIKDKRPEFVALQNVTNDMIKKVKSCTWAARYQITQPPTKFETRDKPTVCLLSTYPPQDYGTVVYHGSTKILLVAYFVMYDKQKKPHVIPICSTHLEPGVDTSEQRELQLNESFLSQVENRDSFIAGGFNLVDSIDGELQLEGGWNDAWLTVPGNTTENGYTCISEAKSKKKEDEFGSQRADRIFFKSVRYKLDAVEVVGKPMAGASASVFPHFGVLASFSHLDVLRRSNPDSEVPCVFKRPKWYQDYKRVHKSASTHPQ